MAETIKTLKPSGGDYTSISAWVSGEAKALGVDAVDVLECYKGDYTALGGGINYIVDDSLISGWSNITPTAYAAIRTPASERHNGKAYDAVGDYTGFAVKKSSIAEHSACIRDNQQQTHTLGLIIVLDKTSGYGDLRALDIGSGGGYGVHGKHIAVSESVATSGGNYLSGIAFGVIAQYYTDRTVSLYDSLVIGKSDGASGKWRMGVACAGSHVYNCTVLHADACYVADKPSNEYAAVYNCIAESNAGGTCYANPGMAGDYNLANDATAPGINSVQSTTLTYTDAANGDYSLASTDTAAIGAGTDDPGAGLYSDDIVGVAFVSPWDMGAFKYATGTIITILDTAAASDVLSNIGAAFGLSDSGSGTDQAPGPAAQFALGDGGAGSDAVDLSALLAMLDAGTGIDSVTSPTVQLSVSDSCSSAEALSASALLALTDTSTGGDSLAVAVSLAVPDQGAGADAITLITDIIKSIADIASASDAVNSISTSVAVSDTGTGYDIPALAVALSLVDTAAGGDALNVIKATLLTIADTAAGSDGVAISVSVPLVDSGSATDQISIDNLLAVIDAAGGIDAVVTFSTATRIATISFTLSQRSMTFTLH